ncbi:hypothetical protein D3C73_892110 [compost metagenome]
MKNPKKYSITINNNYFLSPSPPDVPKKKKKRFIPLLKLIAPIVMWVKDFIFP